MNIRKLISYIMVIAVFAALLTGCKKQDDPIPAGTQNSISDQKPTGNQNSQQPTQNIQLPQPTQNAPQNQPTENSGATENTENVNATVNNCNHILGGWTVEKTSTCTTEGVRHRICTQCKEPVETEAIPMLNHTPGYWVVDRVATCTAEGVQHQSCSQCKTKIITINMEKAAHKPDPTGKKCQVCNGDIS